jgi:hypothetical protein
MARTTYSKDLAVVADVIAAVAEEYKGLYSGLLAQVADDIAERLELPEEWRDAACPWSVDA